MLDLRPTLVMIFNSKLFHVLKKKRKRIRIALICRHTMFIIFFVYYIILFNFRWFHVLITNWVEINILIDHPREISKIDVMLLSYVVLIKANSQ